MIQSELIGNNKRCYGIDNIATFLNSTYGALLNKAFRYNRRELGASTTGTGREITIFMAELIGETLSGEHTEVMKYQLPGDKGKIENHYVCNNELIIYGEDQSFVPDTSK